MAKSDSPVFVAATLPPPQQWSGRKIWRRDLGVEQISDGLAWKTVGASSDMFTQAQRMPRKPTAPTVSIAGTTATAVFGLVPNASRYRLTASPGGLTAEGAGSPLVIAGLTPGVAYTFKLVASAAAGERESDVSASISAVTLPAALSTGNLLCWWDASQEPVVSNGTAKAGISDWSGNGFSASQATGALQPVYVTSANWGGGATGKPAIKFDGTNDFLQSLLSTRRCGPRTTIFVVLAFTGLTNTATARDMRVLTNETSRYDTGWYIGTSDATTGGGGNSCLKVRTDGRSSTTAAGGVVINTPYVFSEVHGRQLFLDGVIAATATGGTGQLGNLLPRTQGIALGSVPGDTNQCFNGSIAEVLVFSDLLTDAQRWAVEAYLASKYGKAAPAQQATIA